MNEKSHVYEVRFPELLDLLSGPLIVLSGFCVGMTLGALLGWLPTPRATVDMDRTIMIHQAHAAHTAPPADILFMGDSSCLMDVSARDLSHELGAPILNLGTVSYLHLDGAALLAGAYASRHPDSKPLLVLLLHPFSLRREQSDPYYLAMINAGLENRDYYSPSDLAGTLFGRLGFVAFRDRLLTRWLGWPLPFDYVPEYGFTTHLWKRMTEDQGGVVASGYYQVQPGQGSSEWHVSRGLLALSLQFQQELPEGFRLAIGITPIPRSFALPNYPARRDALLAEWAEALHPDIVLTQLPTTYPDRLFSSVAHLNEEGRAVFTLRLAGALRSASVPVNK